MKNITKGILAAANALLQIEDISADAFTKAFDNLINSIDLNTHETLEQEAQKAFMEELSNQDDTQAKFLQNVFLHYGIGIEADEAQALSYFEECGNNTDAAATLFMLGRSYANKANGAGTNEDRDEFDAKAFEYYSKAAGKACAIAQNKLGNCYEYGKGVQKDIKIAVEWYQQAAAQGNASAQTNLGLCYALDMSVQRDVAKAVEWYQQAADQGYARAQIILGDCYARCRVVQQALTNAGKWYKKAEAQEYPGARDRLLRLYFSKGYDIDKITEEQLKGENSRVRIISAAERTYHVVANTDELPDDSFKLGVHACTPLEKLTTFNDKNYQFVIYPGVRIDELFKALPPHFENRIVGINEEVQKAINFYRQCPFIEVAGQVATSEAILQEKGLPLELRLPIHAEASGLAPYFSETFLTRVLAFLVELPTQQQEQQQEIKKLEEQVLQLKRQIKQLEQANVAAPRQPERTGFFESKQEKPDGGQKKGMKLKRQRIL